MTANNLVLQFPVVAALTGVCLGLIAVLLAVRVIVQRVRLGVEAGDGGIPAMAQAVRAHANFAEHAPLALLLLAMLETSGKAPWFAVGVIAAVLLLGRALSAIGLSRSLGPSFARQAGASLTILATLVSAIGLFWTVIAAP